MKPGIGDVIRIRKSGRIEPDSGTNPVVLLDVAGYPDNLLGASMLTTHRPESSTAFLVPVVHERNPETGEAPFTWIDCGNLKTFSLTGADYEVAGRLPGRTLDQVFRRLASMAATGVYRNRFRDGSSFQPGQQQVHYAGRVYGENEMINAVEASLDFFLTEGRFAESFSEKIADYLGVDHVLLTNSGSSANLLAVSALTSPRLGDRGLKPGDEVITVAAGFPSTVSPIIQHGLVPVFADIDLETCNIDPDSLKKAISPFTKCIFLAHTMGNPFAVDEIVSFAETHGLWLIEDNCDAFGSRYKGQLTGTFGHLSTISFYPAHHITTGEGGAVVTRDPLLAMILRSKRDWGRDCYCAGGENNTCGRRFSQQFGKLPYGYDHKYVYSELGYNLKMTDIQAAIGSAQIDRLDLFCRARKDNFARLYQIFLPFREYFILPEPTPGADPAWFSFVVTIRENAPFGRNEITGWFSENRVETRPLFAGNLTKHPGFMNEKFRVATSLGITDYVMEHTFIIGVYPGLNDAMISWIENRLGSFLSSKGIYGHR